MSGGRMDRIHFVYRSADDEVEIFINGRSLIDLAGAAELPEARRTREPGLAGSYAWLRAAVIRRQLAHFLGTPQASWFGDGDTVLLGCECADWGCWPLTANIEVSDSMVTWSGFRNGHRDWDLSSFGPFRFGRVDYEQALARLADTLTRSAEA